MYRSFASATASASVSPFVDVESTIRGLTQDLCTAFNTGTKISRRRYLLPMHNSCLLTKNPSWI